MFNKMMMLAMGVLASAGVAQADEIPCNYCSNAQMAAVARQAGIGTHYVYDTYAGNVQKFEVDRERAGNGTYTWWVNPVEVEADVQRIVIDLAAYRQATNGTMVENLNITLYADPDLGGVSAFDVLQPGGQRTFFLNWIQNSSFPFSTTNGRAMVNYSIQSTIYATFNLVRSQQLQATFTVRFVDGTTVKINYDPVTEQLAVVPDSALDAAGNPIPLKPEDALGIRFNYEHDQYGNAQARMEAWLVQLGIHMAATAMPSPAHGMACVQSGDTIVCTPY